jgi:hypothetical protein
LNRVNIIAIGILVSALIVLLWIRHKETGPVNITRDNFDTEFVNICSAKYQAHVVPKRTGETMWLYLAFTGQRNGLSKTTESKDRAMEVDYYILSQNPFQPRPPGERLTFAACEISYLTQNLLGELRKFQLRSVLPYKFIVLVVTNVSLKTPTEDEFYVMYLPDIQKYSVGLEFTGEALKRLTVYKETVTNAYHDFEGTHINYHDLTMKEFVLKQIEWRVYQKFVEGYNKMPFDMSAKEKREEIVEIVKNVIDGYGYKDFEKFTFVDLSENNKAIDVSLSDLERFRRFEKVRLPAF